METNLNNSTPELRQQLFTALYKKAFPAVAGYVSKMGGSFDEAKDVFQDALVIYYEKGITSGHNHQSNQKAYLVGIAKHLWLKRYRDLAGLMPFDSSIQDVENEPESKTYASEKLIHYLETAGQKCMELLRGFYYDKLPADQLSKLFGYSGIRSATVQKYKCLEKVRNTVKQKSLTYEDFLE